MNSAAHRLSFSVASAAIVALALAGTYPALALQVPDRGGRFDDLAWSRSCGSAISKRGGLVLPIFKSKEEPWL